jgi:hypothetical protein
MNKVTTVALAGLMVVAAGAQASKARWEGFGASQAFIADVQDIFTLPGVVSSHADSTYFEFNTTAATTDDWGGVHANLGGGVLALWVNTPFEAFNGIDTGYTIPNSQTLATTTLIGGFKPKTQVYAIYGFNLSDATTLAVGFNRSVGSSKTETVTSASTTSTEVNGGDLGLSLGLEQKEVGPIALLEVGLQYNMKSASQVVKGATATNKVTAGGSAINLRVGGDMAGENGAFSRVELGFNTQNWDLKDEPAVAQPSTAHKETKNSYNKFNLGYAMGATSDKGMGLMGLDLSSKGTSRSQPYAAALEVNKADTSKLALLFMTAGEAKVTNWLSVRAGLEADLFYSESTTTETGASGATTKTTTTKDLANAQNNGKASLGATWTVGDITIDGVLSQSLLFNGVYLTSGTPTVLHSGVSATWPWGGSKN